MELFTPGHLLIVAIVAFVLFFGWKQLPDMSRSLGRSLRVFKTEIKGLGEDDKARDEKAREDGGREPAAEPRALESPRAEFVKPSTATPQTVAEPAEARTRPRPAPRPRA